MKKLFAILLIIIPSWAGAATYYIDNVGGADTNNGTAKGTPWQHCPGMTGCTNNCSSYSHAAGDTFIFKGGVTWTMGVDRTNALQVTTGPASGGYVNSFTDLFIVTNEMIREENIAWKENHKQPASSISLAGYRA